MKSRQHKWLVNLKKHLWYYHGIEYCLIFDTITEKNVSVGFTFASNC